MNAYSHVSVMDALCYIKTYLYALTVRVFWIKKCKKILAILFGGPILYFLHFLYDTSPLGEVVIREVENAFVKKNF